LSANAKKPVVISTGFSKSQVFGGSPNTETIPHSQHDSNSKSRHDAWIYQGIDYHLIPEGNYQAVCTQWHSPTFVPAFGRNSARLDFMLLDEDITLTMFFNFAALKRGQIPGPSSKYFQAWVKVNRGLPWRGQSVSPDIFLEPGLIYIVSVTSGKKDSKGKEKPEFARYSRVDEIIEVTRR
jgi:hypothetical protein